MTKWYEESVAAPDFLVGNFLSEDQRHSVKEIGTNAERAAGTNAQEGHVWDNFSSKTYKDLPSVGTIDCLNPADPGKPYKWTLPAGGPGYYRTPSLVSMWATAPYFHNNTLGKYTGDPSVKGRMEAFTDGVTKLLWPAKRDHVVYKTQHRSYLELAQPILPDVLKPLATDKDDLGRPILKLGPIPAGTPVNLLANIDPDFTRLGGDRVKGTAMLLELCTRIKADLLQIDVQHLDDAKASKVMDNLVPMLMDLCKCPDLEEDRGHDYGADLSDADKNALIEFLKTL